METEPIIGFSNYLRPEIIIPTELIQEGWEGKIYSLDVAGDNKQDTPLIVKVRYAGEVAWEKTRREYEALKIMHAIGFSVPRPFFIGVNSTLGISCLAMEQLSGLSMLDILRSGSVSKDQLLRKFCQIYADMHNIDYEVIPQDSLLRSGDTSMAADINRLAFQVEKFSLPGFERAIGWLRRNEVEPYKRTIVHGDFHYGNVIIMQNQSVEKAFVVDWGNFEISDPRKDLAWSRLLMSTQSFKFYPDDLLTGYETSLGTRVDNISYFDAYSACKRLLTIFISLTRGSDKEGFMKSARKIMEQKVNHIRGVYAVFSQLTGLQIKEVDDFITAGKL